MSDDVLNVTKRESRGTRNARRARREGLIPAILYGHGLESISLSVKNEELSAVIRHGGRVVNLAGDVSDQAMIREVQWDTFGAEVLHVDLTRVKAGESVEIALPLELRGEAPGVKAGGIVEHQLHELELLCPVTALVDRLEVNINSLELGDVITAGQVPIPDGAELQNDPEQVVVQCVEPEAEEEDEAAAPVPGEPEVIGRAAEDEDGE